MSKQEQQYSEQFQLEPNILFIQHCTDCDTLQYPPRAVCKTCLNHELEWKRVLSKGKLISFTILHHSMEPIFQNHLPWKIGIVKLDCGLKLIVHLDIENAVINMDVDIRVLNKLKGVPMYFATKK